VTGLNLDVTCADRPARSNVISEPSVRRTTVYEMHVDNLVVVIRVILADYYLATPQLLGSHRRLRACPDGKF
jgi:hypothetical protein